MDRREGFLIYQGGAGADDDVEEMEEGKEKAGASAEAEGKWR
jgi:hypothetical protein